MPAENDLFFAIDKNDVVAVMHALQAGASPDSISPDGNWSAVQQAVARQAYGALDGLLARGANVNVTGRDDRPAVLLSLTHGGTRAGLAPLLRAGASANHQVAAGHHQTATLVGQSLLHLAISVSDTHAVRLLLAHGADPNVRDSKGHTPLHEAAATQDGVTLFALYRAGGDIEACDDRGCRPLHHAVHRDNVSTVNVLRALGASTWAVMSSGKKVDQEVRCEPLEAAVRTGLAEVVTHVLERQPPSGEQLQRAVVRARRRKLDAVSQVLKLWLTRHAARQAMDEGNTHQG